MEIFIALTKYNTHQQREEDKPLLVVYDLISKLTPLTIVSSDIHEEWDIPFNVHRYSI